MNKKAIGKHTALYKMLSKFRRDNKVEFDNAWRDLVMFGECKIDINKLKI